MIAATSSTLLSTVLATATAASLLLTPASAIVIGFEADEGYQLGDLKNQPGHGTLWTSTGTQANLVIEADAGTGGSGQALVAHKTSSAAFYSFQPSATDLGVPFVNNQTKIAFSFDYRFLGDYNSTGAYLGVTYFRIGTTSGNAISFAFYNNGTVNYSDGLGLAGQKNANAKAAGGAQFYGGKEQWFRIEGELNYATQTYTLSINGVVQTSYDGTRTHLGFNATGPINTYDLNLLSLNVNQADWRAYAIDNLSYNAVTAAVPEPQALGWIGIGVLGMAAAYGRRHR